MSIAYDNATGGSGGGGTISFSHTCAANAYLIAYVAVNNGASVTSITYNGVSMTLVTNSHVSNTFEGYMYYLTNPASGAKTFQVSFGSASTSLACVASYTGVKAQAPEAVNTKTGTGNQTQSVTTVTNNAWTVLGGFAASAGIGAGAGMTSRVTNNASIIVGDSNAGITPPGSNSMTVNGSGNAGLAIVSIAPTPISFTTLDTQASTELLTSIRSKFYSLLDTQASSDSFLYQIFHFGGNVAKSVTSWINKGKNT